MSNVKQVGGVWLPAHEIHMAEWMTTTNNWVEGKLTYQYPRLLEAMKWVRNWGCALDVGAHVGTWSMHLAKRFALLHSFEPVALHRACFLRNVPGTSVEGTGVALHDYVLGHDAIGDFGLDVVEGSSGDSSVNLYSAGDAQMIPLDLFWDNDGPIDFIKLDCNGYELRVVQGAAQTLKTCRPCISIEQKPKCTGKFGLPDAAAIDFLRELGAKVRHEHGGVYVMSWD